MKFPVLSSAGQDEASRGTGATDDIYSPRREAARSSRALEGVPKSRESSSSTILPNFPHPGSDGDTVPRVPRTVDPTPVGTGNSTPVGTGARHGAEQPYNGLGSVERKVSHELAPEGGFGPRYDTQRPNPGLSRINDNDLRQPALSRDERDAGREVTYLGGTTSPTASLASHGTLLPSADHEVTIGAVPKSRPLGATELLMRHEMEDGTEELMRRQLPSSSRPVPRPVSPQNANQGSSVNSSPTSQDRQLNAQGFSGRAAEQSGRAAQDSQRGGAALEFRLGEDAAAFEGAPARPGRVEFGESGLSRVAEETFSRSGWQGQPESAVRVDPGSRDAHWRPEATLPSGLPPPGSGAETGIQSHGSNFQTELESGSASNPGSPAGSPTAVKRGRQAGMYQRLGGGAEFSGTAWEQLQAVLAGNNSSLYVLGGIFVICCVVILISHTFMPTSTSKASESAATWSSTGASSTSGIPSTSHTSNFEVPVIPVTTPDQIPEWFYTTLDPYLYVPPSTTTTSTVQATTEEHIEMAVGIKDANEFDLPVVTVAQPDTAADIV